MALCKLHHAAFDRCLLGIDPEYRIRIRPDVMKQQDDPALRLCLQKLDGCCVQLPWQKKSRPDQEALEYRYQRFLQAGQAIA